MVSEPRNLSTTAPSRFEWRRLSALLLPSVLVAISAWMEGEASPRAWVAIACGGLVGLAGSWIRPHETRPRIWTTGALSLSVASVLLHEPTLWLLFARAIALLLSGITAIRAIAAIEGDHGLAALATEAKTSRTIRVRSLEHLAMGALFLTWGIAALVSGLAWTGVANSSEFVPLASSTGGAVALFAVGTSALLVGSARRLELQAIPRAIACGAAAGFGLVLAMVLAFTSVRADAATALGFAGACSAIVRFARTRDPLLLAKRGRRILTLAIFGGPVVLLAAIASGGHAQEGRGIAMLIALAALMIGALAKYLEEPLLPAKGRLLDALAHATRAIHDRNPRAAIAAALAHLRDAAGHPSESPQLWMLHPPHVFTIDAAGYLREHEAEFPASLLEIASGEPHGIVRPEVLRALEVRRADLRPLLRWLDDRGALFAAVVADVEGESAEGVLIVPAGLRSESLTLEEARASKLFADAFVAACQAKGTIERHLAREQALTAKLESFDDELAALKHAAALDAARHELASARLARPATIGIYSAESRMAYEALERRIQNGASVVLLARAGIDPVPLIARGHLAGPRKDRPLVIVDGTSSREHDVDRWCDKRLSPLALADQGLLVLLDGAALPLDVQSLIARTLVERRPPWEQATPLDVTVALSTTIPLETLVEEGLLAPTFYARFQDASPIALPGLRERAEDLFSIVADRLAREGLRVRGRPLGIHAAAFARLVEHPFEGEDAELSAIVTRLVAHAKGDVIEARDIDALALGSGTGHADEPESSDSIRSRRSS